MAEYTDLYCNSPETAEAVKAYIEEENRRDEDPLTMKLEVVRSALRITYMETGCRFREAVDRQMVGYRDGYEGRRIKQRSPVL